MKQSLGISITQFSCWKCSSQNSVASRLLICVQLFNRNPFKSDHMPEVIYIPVRVRLLQFFSALVLNSGSTCVIPWDSIDHWPPIPGIARAASCGSTTITSQIDADALNNACPTVTGDVTLATNATGNISLDGIRVINGNLASESCTDNCFSLTSLSSSTLVSVSQNMSLISLSGLTSVSLPGLQVIGAQFYLDALPNLQNLSIHALS
jgi:hypothetical protein